MAKGSRRSRDREPPADRGAGARGGRAELSPHRPRRPKVQSKPTERPVVRACRSVGHSTRKPSGSTVGRRSDVVPDPTPPSVGFGTGPRQPRATCGSRSGSSRRAGRTRASVRARDVPRASVGSQGRRPGECAAPESSLPRPSWCGRTILPAQCASSGESPVARTQPALERVRASPRVYRDRARESSFSLSKCSCLKTYGMLRILQ